MNPHVDIRIMGCHARDELINATLGRLGANPEIVTYDDRPNGGDAMYTARMAWLRPFPSGATHRIVLQDDVEVCDGFRDISSNMIKQFPNVVWSLYNPRIRFEHKKQESPYVRISGGLCHGAAVMMPVDVIIQLFMWIDATLGRHYKYDDCAIGEYAYLQNIPVMTTIPSIVQHLGATSSLLGYSDRRKVSKVWIGRDVSGVNWNADRYSNSPAMSRLRVF